MFMFLHNKLEMVLWSPGFSALPLFYLPPSPAGPVFFLSFPKKADPIPLKSLHPQEGLSCMFLDCVSDIIFFFPVAERGMKGNESRDLGLGGASL